MNNPVGRTEKVILFTAITVFVLLHFYQINSPPNGYHQWRESDTSAIILNYYQEDANFLHQRCNQRGDGSGITGGELATYSYTSFIMYFLFGPHHFLARLVTLAGALVGLWFFGRIVTILSNERTALYSTIALAFSPLFLFYSFKIMPDMWMLMFMLGAAYFFLKYTHSESLKYIAWSGVFLILSATTKPLSLCLYLPFLFYLLSSTPNRKRAVWTMAAYGSITFAFVLGWYLYGRYLNSIHHSMAFHMGDIILKSPMYLSQSQFYKKLFLQWPFELWTGWALLPVFIYGAFKLRKNQFTLFNVIWIIASYLVFAILAGHSGSHDYYTLIMAPPLAAISGWGLAEMSLKPKFRTILVIFLLLVLPVVTSVRIYHRFTKAEEFEQMRIAADRHIPRNSLIIVEENTSAVRLYQLNRHGWPFRDELTSDNILRLINSGAKYLILNNPVDSSIKNLVIDSMIQIGPYYGYRTLKPN